MTKPDPGRREGLLRGVLDTVTDGIITIDERGTVHLFNTAAERLFGYESREVVGRNVSLLMPSPYREEHDGYLQHYRETGEARIIGIGRDVAARRKNGTVFPVRLAVSEIQLDGRRMFVGVLRDLTERQEVERKLQREREFTRELAEAAEDLILLADAEGRIARLNRALEEVTGRQIAEVEGRDWIETFVYEAHRERLRRLTDRETRGVVCDFVVRGGATRTVRLASRVITDDRDVPVGTLVVAQDVTELLEAQRKLMNAERLAAIGQMVSGLAHESRNALQRIQANLEMLSLVVQDRPRAVELVGRMQKAQDQLAGLYEEVREFAAPIRLQKQRCEVDRLWRATWTELEAERTGKDLRLVEEAGCDCAVSADPMRLQQVFRNLFENAIQASPEKGEIFVRCTPGVADGAPVLRILVEDQGPGLGADTAERAFEPFYTTKTKGTGLGLPISRRIAEAHGGGLRCLGGPGGARFEVVLPKEGA